MKWLLIATLIIYGLTYWAYRAADRPGDDFGAAVPFLLGALVSLILTVVYIALAFWMHRFW